MYIRKYYRYACRAMDWEPYYYTTIYFYAFASLVESNYDSISTL
jgi:hypothetical protein